MKRTITLTLALLVMLSLLAACTQSSNPGAVEGPPNSEQHDAQSQSMQVTQEPEKSTDIRHTIGEGVTVDYTVVNDEASLEITGCPSYGDKMAPYVYGELTNGDPFDYELITIIIVGGSYYGKKPFNNSPNAMIKSDGSFMVQFSSNDGIGTDWNADNILIFLVPSGYKDEIEPDIAAGYVVPPSQVTSLKDNSICVVQIDRKIPMP